MTASNKRKQSLYFPEQQLEEIREQAVRLDRSLSWIVQRAWRVAHKQLKDMPSTIEVDEVD